MAHEIGLSTWDGATGLEAVPVSSTAYYALQLPDGGIGPDTKTLVVLHGWGQSAPAFIRRFQCLRTHDIVVIAPQAPYQFYLDMETRKVGFGWLTSFDRRRGIADGMSLVDTVLSTVSAKHALPINGLFLLGFSQGVAVAFRYGLYGARPAAGVVACGGDLPPDVEAKLPDVSPFPVMLVHGMQDTVVPQSKSVMAETALRAHDFPVLTAYFEGGHEVPDEAAARLPAWMTENVRSLDQPGFSS